jgi:hypothetical protein
VAEQLFQSGMRKESVPFYQLVIESEKDSHAEHFVLAQIGYFEPCWEQMRFSFLSVGIASFISSRIYQIPTSTLSGVVNRDLVLLDCLAGKICVLTAGPPVEV